MLLSTRDHCCLVFAPTMCFYWSYMLLSTQVAHSYALLYHFYGNMHTHTHDLVAPALGTAPQAQCCTPGHLQVCPFPSYRCPWPTWVLNHVHLHQTRHLLIISWIYVHRTSTLKNKPTTFWIKLLQRDFYLNTTPISFYCTTLQQEGIMLWKRWD